MPAVPTQTFLVEVQANMLAGILDTGFARLFQNNPVLDLETVLADLVAPTFTGYAPIAIVWSDPAQDADGNMIFVSNELTFQPTNDTNLPQTVMGWGLTGVVSAATLLLLANYFETPVPMASTLSALSFNIVLKVPNQQVWGDARVTYPVQ